MARTRLRSIARRLWPPKPKPLILMYHRIADKPVDYWNLAVSPTRFKEQLRVLRNIRYPLALKEFFHRLMAGTLPPNAVALTFDDGYVDNLVSAKPLLEQHDVPAMIFLATGYTDCSECFWWDELENLILFGSGPQFFDFSFRDHLMRIDFGNEAPAREDDPIPRQRLRKRSASLLRIWEVLRRLDDEERSLALAKLRSNLGGLKYRADLGRAMTSNEVRALVASGLLTIGAHSVTHPVLAELPAAACRREMTESKRACEDLLSAPVSAISYPYGSFDAKVCEAAKAAGFKSGFSTQHGPVIATSDVFALPRIHISNLDGNAFERKLRSASAAG